MHGLNKGAEHYRIRFLTVCCLIALVYWIGSAGALLDVHSASERRREVAFVGVSHMKGEKHNLDGLCALGNSLRMNGGVHGILYALVRKPLDRAHVLRLEGVHCAWTYVLTEVTDVEEELRQITEKHELVVVLTDSQLVTGSLAGIHECEERCSLAGAHSFVMRNMTDASWPSPPGKDETDYSLVWSVAHNGTAVRAGAGLVDFGADALWLPWHWQSATLDGVYAVWRAMAMRQSPDVTVFCLLMIHMIGLITVSPDTVRAESAFLGQREGNIENMSRMQRACHMFFWSYLDEEGKGPLASRPELTVGEALLSFIFSFFHVTVVLCYFSFAWLEETASVQYDVAFSLLIIGCSTWGAAVALLCLRAMGHLSTSSIHFWRFYFGFACVSCAYPLTLKMLTGEGWFEQYSFTPTYALSVTICLLPIWTMLSSLIQLDHILSVTRA